MEEIQECCEQLIALLADIPARPKASGAVALEFAALLERTRDALYTAELTYVRELDETGFAAILGRKSLPSVLRDKLRITGREARERLTDAEHFTPEMSFTGEELPAQHPATAAGMRTGDISAAHARIIRDTVHDLPDTVDITGQVRAEEHLAEAARRVEPSVLKSVGQRLLQQLGYEAEPPTDDEIRKQEFLTTTPLPDGGCTLRGRLGPENTAVLRSVLNARNQPRPVGDIPDTRTQPQRNADALVEALREVLDSGALPETGGVKPHVGVTVTFEALKDMIGAATLDTGQCLTPEAARRIACDAKITPVVMGGENRPLDVGRARRTAPSWIRRALIIRDRGCAFPYCDRPPDHTQVHHVEHWVDHGDTSVDNCTLLCTHHHHAVHEGGWTIQLRAGIPWFRPPRWLDPDQPLLRNTIHRPETAAA